MWRPAKLNNWESYHPLIWVVFLSIFACDSSEKDPRLLESREALSEVLSYMPAQELNKDSLLAATQDLMYEEHSLLVTQLNAQFEEIITEKKAAIEREQKVKAQFDLRDGFHTPTKFAVQQSMDDPDSFVHEGTTYVDKGDTIYVSMKFKMSDLSGTIRSYLIESKVDIEGNVLEGDISRLSD